MVGDCHEVMKPICTLLQTDGALSFVFLINAGP